MINWEPAATRFVTQTGKWERDNDVAGFIPYSLGILRKLTGAYMALQIVSEDSYIARVRDATPSFINDVAFAPELLTQFLEEHRFQVIQWKTIPEKHTVISDILLALSSAVVIPVKYNDKYLIVILGWLEPQTFGGFFDEFVQLVQSRLQEILMQCYEMAELQRRAGHMLAILRTLPYGLVFISDDGTGSGWINRRAQALLALDDFGIHPPEVLARAMAELRNKMLNHEELNQQAMALFSSSSAKMENWIWKTSESSQPDLKVSCLPVVEQDVIRGRLWIFQEEK